MYELLRSFTNSDLGVILAFFGWFIIGWYSNNYMRYRRRIHDDK